MQKWLAVFVLIGAAAGCGSFVVVPLDELPGAQLQFGASASEADASRWSFSFCLDAPAIDNGCYDVANPTATVGGKFLGEMDPATDARLNFPDGDTRQCQGPCLHVDDFDPASLADRTRVELTVSSEGQSRTLIVANPFEQRVATVRSDVTEVTAGESFFLDWSPATDTLTVDSLSAYVDPDDATEPAQWWEHRVEGPAIEVTVPGDTPPATYAMPLYRSAEDRRFVAVLAHPQVLKCDAEECSTDASHDMPDVVMTVLAP